ARDGILIGDFGEEFGVGVEAGVGGVDAIDLGGLHEDVGADFVSAQGGGGVGGEEGVAGAAGEDDDDAAFEMADGAAADVGFGDFTHLDGGEDAGLDADAFEVALHGEAVDHGGDHADVVGRRAVHVLDFGAADDVAGADDDADL